jgi:predicted alpha/beta hydrolase family esterase
MKVTRIGLAPRWNGTAGNDWYPWLDRARRELGPSTIDVLAGGAPPVVDRWVPRLVSWLASGPPEGTLLVGHSVGCQAWLRALERCSGRGQVSGLLCVAGWWTVDEPWQTLIPWMDPPVDAERVRAKVRAFEVVLGEGDPFTADQCANANLWKRLLGASVTRVANGGHFNGPECAPALGALARLWPEGASEGATHP